MAAGAFSVFAPAKINLALHVTGQRPDSYHRMDMLVAFASVGDTVSVQAADVDSFAVSGRYALAVPADAANLVLRARDALRAAADRRQPVAIALDKQLPPASGMGGGSSDAAATLKALMRLWDIAPGAIDLAALALGLGADVPMCLAGRALRARGVGEILDPVAGLPQIAALLVNPGVEVATPAVFRALKKKDNAPLPDFPGAADAMELAAWLVETRNDLQTPAIGLAPAIGEALAALEATNPLFARMTGSGATCFGIFGTDIDAAAAADRISSAHPGWYVAATSLG